MQGRAVLAQDHSRLHAWRQRTSELGLYCAEREGEEDRRQLWTSLVFIDHHRKKILSPCFHQIVIFKCSKYTEGFRERILPHAFSSSLCIIHSDLIRYVQRDMVHFAQPVLLRKCEQQRCMVAFAMSFRSVLFEGLLTIEVMILGLWFSSLSFYVQPQTEKLYVI